MENSKSQVLSERLHDLITEVANSIRPKVDEVRTGRVMGAANSEMQIAGTMVQAVIAMGLVMPDLLPYDLIAGCGTGEPRGWFPDDLSGDFSLTGKEMLSFPKADLPELATRYVDAMETERTNRWCKCEWIIHPEDVDKPQGERRISRGAPALDCAVHTKIGFILGFFEWMFNPDTILGAPTVTTVDNAEHRTPREWLKDEPRSIVDNDGWTFSEWEAQAPITYRDFMRRMSLCTTAPVRKPDASGN